MAFKRTIPLAVSLAVLLFLSGGVLGWSVSHLGSPESGDSEPAVSPRPHPHWVESIHKRMSHRLKLDDEQDAQLRQVLEHRVERLDLLYERIEPELADEFQALQNDIRQILTDDQYEHWERMLERMQDGGRPRGRGQRGGRRDHDHSDSC